MTLQAMSPVEGRGALERWIESPAPPAGDVPLDALGLLWVLVSGVAEMADGTTPLASLADHTCSSVRVIQRLLRTLEQAELITRVPTKPGGPNRIVVSRFPVRKAA